MPKVQDLDLPPEKLDDLAAMLIEKFMIVKKARQTQVDSKALNWQKNYDATPAQEVRTVPFYRASNFMPHLIRMHSDILGARVLGFLFGTKPFWMVKSLLKDILDHETLEDLSLGMNYLWDTDLHGFETADEIVNQALQTGTLTLKALWSDETTSYMDGTGNFAERTDEGMQYEPVPFEDFWPYPITARDTKRAEILFHRIRLTGRDVKDRGDDGRWDSNAASLMFKEAAPDPTRQATAQSSGIELTADSDYPYSAIEAWLSYDIADKRRPIVVQFNPLLSGREAILRAFYNFMPYGENAFIDFKPMPRKGSYFGYAVPEILEQSQEEQAQIHNARRDANTIANVPSFKKKRYADVPNPATDWYPGCVIELDEMDDLDAFAIQSNYNSMIDEEQFSLSLAERYVGISPSMQGFGAGQAAGKRGVYSTGGTLALLSEGNKRLDIYLRRLRAPFHRVGRLTALSYNQFAPNYWDRFGPKGAKIREAFNLIEQKTGAVLYDLAASEASANREIDRQNLLQMAGTMANYYEKIIELTSAIKQMPENDPLRAVALMVLDGARDLVQRLLFSFDIGNRERIVPDVRKTLEGDGAKGAPDQHGGLPGAQGTVQPAQLQSILENIASVSGKAG